LTHPANPITLQSEPDPWSQSGGWVLDLEGRVTTRTQPLPPREVVVRDVWASLEASKPDPNADPRPWGPLPMPKPGPGPDPMP
jgi:hypothetical protein